MNHVKISVNNKNEFVKYDSNNNIDNFIVLFYDSSHDNAQEATKNYAELLRVQDCSIFVTPILSNRSFGSNDYILLDSAAIVSCEDVGMAIRIIRCGDNLITSIQAAGEEEALSRINNLAEGYLLFQACSHGHLF